MSTNEKPGAIVQPLGVFGPARGKWALTAESLTPLRDEIGPELRASVASYLRSGTAILALMSYTEDILDGRFGVSGGSAVLSDGVYYWRRDAAEYIEEYGIAIPVLAIAHMRKHNWRPAELDEQQLRDIDQYLFAELGAS